MSTIGIALYYLFDILSWIIVIKSFMTWLPSGGGKFYDVLSTITEPIEAPIRSVMYKYTNGRYTCTYAIKKCSIESIYLRQLLYG